jgi:fructokinase
MMVIGVRSRFRYNRGMSGHTVVCFGEALWDSLPRGIFPGGAPVNVAYHLHRFGLNAVPVTAVGNDFLGDEYVRRFRYWELPSDFVGRIDKPTGAVVVDMNESGIPTYHFLENVAWDAIELPDSLHRECETASALVFGTLAQRSPANRQKLTQLRSWLGQARHVFDVNLRAPYDDPGIVWESANGCDLIKLNHEELLKLLNLVVTTDALKTGAKLLSERTGCPRICVTAGAKGAGLWWADQWYWEPAQPVAVKDTVGAGDAFLAALLHGWLVTGLMPEANLQRASRVAEFVTTCDGAMPVYGLNAAGLPVHP